MRDLVTRSDADAAQFVTELKVIKEAASVPCSAISDEIKHIRTEIDKVRVALNGMVLDEKGNIVPATSGCRFDSVMSVWHARSQKPFEKLEKAYQNAVETCGFMAIQYG